MRARNISAILIIAVIVSGMTGMVALASPSHPVSGTFVNDGGVPEGSNLVLNIGLKVTNDEDSGIFGYWAIDDFNKNIQVWQIPDGSFYAVVKYEGKFQTFAGALSPMAGVVQANDAIGTFEGGYVATFKGTFTPGKDQKTDGFIGTFDYGGSKADILLQKYGNGQTGPTTPYNYLTAYFSGVTDFAQPHWGWTYRYKSQTWNNYASADGGNSGDIIT